MIDVHVENQNLWYQNTWHLYMWNEKTSQSNLWIKIIWLRNQNQNPNLTLLPDVVMILKITQVRERERERREEWDNQWLWWGRLGGAVVGCLAYKNTKIWAVTVQFGEADLLLSKKSSNVLNLIQLQSVRYNTKQNER